MIEFDRFSFSYGTSKEPSLRNVTLRIPPGGFALVAGASGSGKSTLLRAACGLVPHFYGGRVEGSVRVAGRDVLAAKPRDLVRDAGIVFQDPEEQIVAASVARDVAFGLENLAAPPGEMEERVGESLEALGLRALADRVPAALSGGELQKTAIAGCVAMRPSVLLLDEPTSSLSPRAASGLLAVLAGLRARFGLAIVLAEHRLDRLLTARTGGPDRVVMLERGRVAFDGTAQAAVSAPAASGLLLPGPRERAPCLDDVRPPLVEMRGVHFAYGGARVLRGVDLALRPGEIVALLGENGAGKTTLLKHSNGLLRPASGEVRVLGQPSAARTVAQLARHVGLVSQNPNDHLTQDSVLAELAFTLRLRGVGGAAAEARIGSALDALALRSLAARHPRTLSGGERQRLAIASVLVAEPEAILLDEPTRGLHAALKAEILGMLRVYADRGRAVLFATHDVALARAFAGRELRLEGGVLAERFLGHDQAIPLEVTS